MPSATITLSNSPTVAELIVNFVEPSTKIDGSPMTDLKQFLIEISHDEGRTFNPILSGPVTSPNGGGVRSITIPGLPVPNGASFPVVQVSVETDLGFKSYPLDINVLFDSPVPAQVG